MTNVKVKIVFLLILLSSFLWSVKPHEFVSYASDIIFNGCKGNDIYLNRNITYIPTNRSFNKIPWPYNQNLVADVFFALSKVEPFAECVGPMCMSLGGSPIGTGLLKCGNNTLDASRYDYLWNKQKIEQPATLVNYAPNNTGNLVQGQSICNVNQQQLTETEIYLNSTKQELNNCTVNLNQTQITYANFKEEANLSSFVSDLVTSIIGSAVFYLLLYPRSDKNRKRNCLFLLLICILIAIIIYGIRVFILK